MYVLSIKTALECIFMITYIMPFVWDKVTFLLPFIDKNSEVMNAKLNLKIIFNIF